MSHGATCSWFQPVEAWLWHTYTEKLVSDQGMVIQLGRCNYPFNDWDWDFAIQVKHVFFSWYSCHWELPEKKKRERLIGILCLIRIISNHRLHGSKDDCTTVCQRQRILHIPGQVSFSQSEQILHQIWSLKVVADHPLLHNHFVWTVNFSAWVEWIKHMHEFSITKLLSIQCGHLSTHLKLLRKISMEAWRTIIFDW